MIKNTIFNLIFANFFYYLLNFMDNTQIIKLINKVRSTIKDKESAKETLTELKNVCKVRDDRRNMILNGKFIY